MDTNCLCSLFSNKGQLKIDALLEYGVLGIALGGVAYYVLKITNFLQKDLIRKLDENDKRIEQITIGLINAIRDLRLDVKYLKGFVSALKNRKDKK